jgi:tRNA/tmRNA/rRNA uracil-C5-methylase (TrmA/RlmC/RlmD family)
VSRAPHVMKLPAPQKVCKHVAAGCQGCKLIEASYEVQLAAKTSLVKRTLAPLTEARVKPMVPSPKQWHYRERGTFVQDGPVVGLRGVDGRVVDIPECLVLSEAVVRRMNELRREESPSGERTVAFTAVGDQVATSLEASKRLRAPVLQAKGYMFANPMVFGQANRAVADLIAEHVLNIVTGDAHVTRVLELYAGAGTLTLPLALSRRFDTVVAVESSEEACQMAYSAVKEQRLPVEIMCSDVAVGVGELRRKRAQFDAVVVNPPWHGMGRDVREMISKWQFRELRHMVYVSCNPRTLARDIAHLELMGWHTASVVPFDMMPQTRESEVVVHLRRTTSEKAPPPPPVFRTEKAAVVDAVAHEFEDCISGMRVQSKSEVAELMTWTALVRGQVSSGAEKLRKNGQTSTITTLEKFPRATLVRLEGELGYASLCTVRRIALCFFFVWLTHLERR